MVAQQSSPASPEYLVPLFRLRDYTQQALHFAAYAGLAVAVGFWAGPVAVAIGVGIASFLTLRVVRTANRVQPDMFKKRVLALDDKTELGRAVSDFTLRAGLSKKPDLCAYEFNKKVKKAPPKKEGVYTLPRQMQRAVDITAGVAGLRHPVLIVSKDLLNLMPPQETRAVIAHEFAHLGAQHTGLTIAEDLMHMFIISSAWVGLIGIVGTMGTSVAILTSLPVELGFLFAANLLKKSYSRRLEFQADRGAVALGANPLDLIVSLRKTEAVIMRDDPEQALSRDWRQGPWPGRMLKRATSLFKTHPATQRRCGRLAKIAARQKYSRADIAAALTDPVYISILPAKEKAPTALDNLRSTPAFSAAILPNRPASFLPEALLHGPCARRGDSPRANSRPASSSYR